MCRHPGRSRGFEPTKIVAPGHGFLSLAVEAGLNSAGTLYRYGGAP